MDGVGRSGGQCDVNRGAAGLTSVSFKARYMHDIYLQRRASPLRFSSLQVRFEIRRDYQDFSPISEAEY